VSIWLPHTRRILIPTLDHGPRAITRGVVIHSTEGDSLPTSWFQRGSGGVGAHVAVGNREAVQYVSLDRKCWHAVEANGSWIGFEHVAHASWSRDDWMHHHRMLELSANRVAWVLHDYELGRPKAGVNIRSHASGGAAWGGHHDPGGGFPWPHYLGLVHEAYMTHWGRR